MNPPRRRNLTASQAAIHLGVSAKALRLYEDQGLIAPGRSTGGWRLYDPAEVERAAWIVSLRALGLSLAQIGLVMGGDQSALNAGLAAHEERLLGQVHHIHATLRKVRDLREGILRGETVGSAAVDAALRPEDATGVALELPWPWAGEWFELPSVPRLTFITGPLGSGKTRFAQCLATELPGATFLGLDRRASGAGAHGALEASLAARVDRAMEWLIGEGAEPCEALLGLVVALQAKTAGTLIVDMVEEGLSEPTQRALMAFLRMGPGQSLAVVLMTRSSSILDLDLVSPDEAIIYCPANHRPPFRASIEVGGRGYEAVETCLATPEARRRTASITATISAAAA